MEDDPADIRLMQEVLREGTMPNRMWVARDGEEALAFLRKEGRFGDEFSPDLVLLDLNLPGKDGREVLAEMKADPKLSYIPVVVLTTSSAEEDVMRAYALHANCYVTKPLDLNRYIEVIAKIEEFWLSITTLPKV